ncbi:MAG: HEPN domain-containing protein [Candidatus Tectomicrobia bacterium]|nr:HEPN domain-containing protein [Candidatus Tectomicrobia bacterium]
MPEQMKKAWMFLQDAQLCVDHSRYDSSASRTYYAMFRAAIALMERYSYLRPSWNHGRLKGALVRTMVEERTILTHREVEELEAAYALRLEAD